MALSSQFTRDEFEARIERFEEDWLSDTRTGPPRIDAYLPPAQLAAEKGYGRRELLHELIMIDLECRWRENKSPRQSKYVTNGSLPEHPLLEDYIDQYPDLGTVAELPAELIAQEYQVRRRWGDKPSHDEYGERFKSSGDQLIGLLSHEDEEIEESGFTVHCPYCDTPVAFTEETEPDDISCPSCGDSFSLFSRLVRDKDEFEPKSIGQFEQLTKIGVGGFGTVWRAWDKKLERWVALKLPRRRLSKGGSETFLREAKAAARLDHPNIIKVYDVKAYGEDSEQGIVYIICAYIEGQSFDGWLRVHHPKPREAAELCQKVASAIHHAHQSRIIHRDLKPSNIILDGQGEPHVTDFGLCRDAAEVTTTGDGQIIGTAAYMSPEQAKGEGHTADARSDIYSLGVVFFEMLTGERPFREGNVQKVLNQVIGDDPPSPRTRDARVPKDLETICLKCLKKDPAQRYQTAEELSDELSRFLHGEPIKARPVSALERTIKWTKRRPTTAMLIAVSILAVASLAGSVWEYQKRLENLSNDLEKHLNVVETALVADHVEVARANIDSFFQRIKGDKRFQELLDRARELKQHVLTKENDVEDVKKSREEADKVRKVYQLHEEAILSGLQPIAVAASSQRSLEFAQKALSEAGVLHNREADTLLTSEYLNPQVKNELRRICYELFLVMAEVTFRQGQEKKQAAEEALEYLNDLERASLLEHHTRAYRIQRAQYAQYLDGQHADEREDPYTPQTPFDRFLMGRLEMERQNYKVAGEFFERALKDESLRFWARYYKAVCLFRDDQWESAHELLLQCVTEKPELVWPQITAGFASGMAGVSSGKAKNALRAETRFGKAEEYFNEAQRLAEDDEYARYILLVHRGVVRFEHAEFLGTKDSRRRKHLDAANDLKDAIKLAEFLEQKFNTDELSSYVKVNLAVVYGELAALSEEPNELLKAATDQCGRAIAKNDKLPAPYRERAKLHLGLAMNLREKGSADDRDAKLMFSNSQNDIQKAIELETDNARRADSYVLQGEILIKQGETAHALLAYAEAHRLFADHLQALRGLAACCTEEAKGIAGKKEKKKIHRKAGEYLDQYIDKSRESASEIEYDVFRDRGVARIQTDDFHGAIEDFTDGLKILSDSNTIDNEQTVKTVNLHFLRGYAYYKCDSPQLADADFTQVIDDTRKPDDFTDVIWRDKMTTNAYCMRGWTRLSIATEWNEYDSAIGDLSEAIVLNSKYTNAYYGRGLARLKMLASPSTPVDHPAILQMYDAAEKDFSDAIDSSPANALSNTDSHYARCRTQIARGAAREAMRQILTAKIDRERLYELILKDYEGAIADAELVVGHRRGHRDLLNAAIIYAEAFARMREYVVLYRPNENDRGLRKRAIACRDRARELINQSIKELPRGIKPADFWDNSVITNQWLSTLWPLETNKDDLKRRYLELNE